jgi:hypothetical protein
MDKLEQGYSYGRSMALVNSAVCSASGCPINGAAMTGCSGELGFLPYFELKEKYIDAGELQQFVI